MHSSVHYGLGIIFAGITSLLIPINFWIVAIIILSAIFADFDIFLKNYAQDGNHRMLLTHSIYLPILLLVIGIISSSIIIIMAGISYFLHIVIDLLDWGTNVFYTKKIYGVRILLKKDEYFRVKELMHQEKIPQWFFVKRYYRSYAMILIEIGVSLGMFMVIFVYIPQFWYFIGGYIFTLTFHLVEYFELKHISAGGSPRIKLLKH